ncbi:hypothetical protein Tco_0731632 [Tanacetum coccineum]
MADHSHNWHDGLNSRKVSNGSSDGIAAVTNKLDSLGRDTKKLKKNVHDIQVGCETCGGAHLNKECPLHEEVKSVKEVKIRECKAIFTKNGLSLYTPFYYSREEIEYISANLSFSEEETHKEIEKVMEIEETTAHHLGASVSIMPFLMYKRLGIGKLKPINMIIEMADKTRSVPRGTVEIYWPLLDTAHAKVDVFGKSISLEVGNEKIVFKIKDKFNETLTPIESVCAIRNEESVTDDQCDGGDLPDNTEKNYYWGCLNDDKRLNVAWEGMSFKDWVRVSHGKKYFGGSEIITKLILDAVLDKLDDDWFTRTINDEDDLDGIIPKTSANIVAARAELMEEMDTAGSVQREMKTMLEYNLKTQ